MLYSLEKTKAIQKKDVAFLPAGIHDDVSWVDVRYEETPNNAFIEFKFEKNGRTMTHTEWQPQQGSLPYDAFQNSCTNQVERIRQILSCFYDELSFEGDSFKALAEWVIDRFNNADKSKKVRIKVVYNDRGYTTLPRYTKYTFIEPMDKVERNESVISKLSIDKFEKPEITTDSEQPKSNPFDVVDGSLSNTSDDLPF